MRSARTNCAEDPNAARRRAQTSGEHLEHKKFAEGDRGPRRAVTPPTVFIHDGAVQHEGDL